MNKYLKPKNYVNYAHDLINKLLLVFKKTLTLRAKSGLDEIIFVVGSNKEYALRYKNSYTGEKETVNWINNIDYKNSIIWDIGANVGAYSLLMGKKCSKISSTHIYAFEPESGNYYSLNRNIRANKLENKISALPIALSNSTKVSEFYLSSTEVGSATHSLHEPISEGLRYEPKSRQSAIAIRGDDLISNFEIPAPNYLKIDVDGHELEVLEGLSNVIKSQSLKSVVIEISEKVSNGRIEKFLLDSKFKIIAEEVMCNDESNKIINYVFTRN